MESEKKAVRRVAKRAKQEAPEAVRMMNSVSLVELAGELGVPPEVATQYIGVENVHQDWAGRPCVRVEVAAEAISAARRDAESANAKQAAYNQALAEFTERRTRIGSEAYERAFAAELARGKAVARSGYASLSGLEGLRSSPAARSAGQAARNAALAEFDAKHQPPR